MNKKIIINPNGLEVTKELQALFDEFGAQVETPSQSASLK